MTLAEEGENANLKTKCGVDIDMMHKCNFQLTTYFKRGI